jgi:hypothetical protein
MSLIVYIARIARKEEPNFPKAPLIDEQPLIKMTIAESSIQFFLLTERKKLCSGSKKVDG